MMRVTVTRYLNVRVGKPSLNAPCYRYLDPGTELEVDGILYKGDRYNGVDDWMKDDAGNYYWLGGLSLSAFTAGVGQPLYNSYAGILKDRVDWNCYVPQVPQSWRQSRGKGVKVAILDSGVFSGHEDLRGAIAAYEDFTPVNDRVDYLGHGTHVAGLIGARTATLNGLTGVAPEAELICLKVLPDRFDGTIADGYQPVIAALEEAERRGAKIINLSFSLRAEEGGNDPMKTGALRDKIAELAGKGILLVAAAGDNLDLSRGELFFPSSSPGVISVASVRRGYFEAHPVVPPGLNIVGPTVNYLSAWIDPAYYKASGGCSMTAAFISGIAALALSDRQADGHDGLTRPEFLRQLNGCSIPMEAMDYTDDQRFYFHLINPGT